MVSGNRFLINRVPSEDTSRSWHWLGRVKAGGVRTWMDALRVGSTVAENGVYSMPLMIEYRVAANAAQFSLTHLDSSTQAQRL